MPGMTTIDGTNEDHVSAYRITPLEQYKHMFKD